MFCQGDSVWPSSSRKRKAREDDMQMMPSLQVKQKQALVMTPQLQQAIKLLQMTNLDICNYLQDQALENLKKAIKLNPGLLTHVETTSDFDRLKDSDGFKKLIQGTKEAQEKAREKAREKEI